MTHWADMPLRLSLHISLSVLLVGLEPAEPEQEKSPPPPEADPTFFNKVDEDVHRMIRGEKMQEEYRKVRKYKLFHFQTAVVVILDIDNVDILLLLNSLNYEKRSLIITHVSLNNDKQTPFE